MLDHIGLTVKDIAKSKAFYAAALKPLGYEVVMEFGGQVAGLGAGGKPDFWLAQGAVPQQPMHIAFAATDRAAVTAFYYAALAAGGQDNGAPGIRAQYHPNYFGAFIIDPDGHNIEAVCHSPA